MCDCFEGLPLFYPLAVVKPLGFSVSEHCCASFLSRWGLLRLAGARTFERLLPVPLLDPERLWFVPTIVSIAMHACRASMQIRREREPAQHHVYIAVFLARGPRIIVRGGSLRTDNHSSEGIELVPVARAAW